LREEIFCKIFFSLMTAILMLNVPNSEKKKTSNFIQHKVSLGTGVKWQATNFRPCLIKKKRINFLLSRIALCEIKRASEGGLSPHFSCY